jgi:DNA topoisomerase-1
MKTLIIVESPHKAQAVAALARPAIKGQVFAWACLGHLRDLPDERLAVDIEHGFTPEYVIPKNREKTVAALREKIAQADVVLLATDPDREGEAVAWHVLEVFAAELAGKTVRRVAFAALTPAAVRSAMKRPRPVDMRLAWAAAARRVLDRLVGYFVTPELWKQFPNRKGEGEPLPNSAGRVQTAALRLLVEHERAQGTQAPSTGSGQAETWVVEVDL